MIRKIQKLIKTKKEPFAINCGSREEIYELLCDLGNLGFVYDDGEPILNEERRPEEYKLDLFENSSAFCFYNSFPYFTCGRKNYFKKQNIEVLEFREIKLSRTLDRVNNFSDTTYIELFDSTAIENICSALAQAPKKVVFIGSRRDEMRRACRDYSRILSKNGELIEFSYVCCKESLSEVVYALGQLVESEEKCCFDITGGSDIFLMALGIVCEKHRDKNIQLHRFDIENQTIIDCDNDGIMPFDRFPSLTVDENIAIYGGERTNMTKKYIGRVNKKDLNELWSILTHTSQVKWNETASSLAGIVSAFSDSDGICRFSFSELKTSETAALKSSLFKALKEKGLVHFEVSDKGKMTLKFKSEFVRSCLTLSGLVLELKICSLAEKAKEKDGITPFFNDVKTGVVIKWKDEDDGADKVPINEIDVMMTDGLIPIFVSCKNGKVTLDELYKLNTVAENFGSKYSRKILIVNDLRESKSLAAEAFRLRAKMMNIKLVEKVHSLSDEKITEELINYNKH